MASDRPARAQPPDLGFYPPASPRSKDRRAAPDGVCVRVRMCDDTH